MAKLTLPKERRQDYDAPETRTDFKISEREYYAGSV